MGQAKYSNISNILKIEQLFPLYVRRSGAGVVSWTCDPVLALGQRFDSHSHCAHCAAILLGKGLTVMSMFWFSLIHDQTCQRQILFLLHFEVVV